MGGKRFARSNLYMWLHFSLLLSLFFFSCLYCKVSLNLNEKSIQDTERSCHLTFKSWHANLRLLFSLNDLFVLSVFKGLSLHLYFKIEIQSHFLQILTTSVFSLLLQHMMIPNTQEESRDSTSKPILILKHNTIKVWVNAQTQKHLFCCLRQISCSRDSLCLWCGLKSFTKCSFALAMKWHDRIYPFCLWSKREEESSLKQEGLTRFR